MSKPLSTSIRLIMSAIKKITSIFLLGLTIPGCKTIINAFAFHPDVENVISTSKLPYGIQEITIKTADKIKITSLYLTAEKSDKLLIYFHGNAGNIYHRIPSLSQIHQFGINVIGASYRGYGKSEGKPSEEGVYADGKAILKHAVEDLGYSIENIIIFGRSIGTTVAINTAQHEDIRGVILVTPFTNGKEQATAGGLGVISILAGDSFDNLAKVENIKSPLLVIHGTKDQIIPYAMGKEIYDRATVPKEFVKIEGGNHNNLQDVYEQDYWLPILRFINTAL